MTRGSPPLPLLCQAMKALFKAQFHYQITPEVRRELFSGHSRGGAAASSVQSVAMDE